MPGEFVSPLKKLKKFFKLSLFAPPRLQHSTPFLSLLLLKKIESPSLLINFEKVHHGSNYAFCTFYLSNEV